MSKVTVGIYLPCGVNVSPQPFFADGYESIQNAVDGVFDAVTTNCNSDKMLFVGFVNDNGIADELEYNYLATNMFRKELYGNCVVFWGLNADGINDGEIYDIPDTLFSAVQELLEQSTADAYNMSVGMAEVCNFAVENGIASKVEIRKAIDIMVNATLNGEDTISPLAQNAIMWLINEVLYEVVNFIGHTEDESLKALRDFCFAMVAHLVQGAEFVGDTDDDE